MKYNFEIIKARLQSQGKVDDENIKLMLEILNQDLVPEPTNFKFKSTTDFRKIEIYQCPIFLLHDGSLVAVWNEAGLILKQYKNAVNSHVSWLYKCTPDSITCLDNDDFCDYSNEVIFQIETVLKESAPIHSNLHYYKKQEDKLIQYFGADEIVQALIVAYNTCISEQTLLKNRCQNILKEYETFYERKSKDDAEEWSVDPFEDTDPVSIIEHFIENGSFFNLDFVIAAMVYVMEKIRVAKLEKELEEVEKLGNFYYERGEWRDGKYYPDWLGGMESEEDFWEH